MWLPLRYFKFYFFFVLSMHVYLQENIAAVLVEQGKLAEALEMLQEVLRVRVATLGPDHPLIAGTKWNIGIVLLKQAKYDEALSLLNEALQVKKKLLGEEHSDVASIMEWIGNVRKQQGHYEMALKTYEHTLRIRNTVLGHEHPHVAAIKDKCKYVPWVFRRHGFSKTCGP